MTKSYNKIQEAIDSVNCVCTLLQVKDIIPLGRIVEDYYNYVLQHNGKRLATSQLKALYNEACYYVVGQTIKPSTPLWLKRNKKTMFPYILKPFEPYLSNKEVLKTRLALSYLRVYEVNILEPVPDFSTITLESNGAEGFHSISSDYKEFLENSPWGRTLKRLYKDESSRTRKTNKQFHYTTKMGVCGSAIGTCGKQSLAINDEIQEYLEKIDKSFKRRDFSEILYDNQDFYANHDDIVKSNDLASTSLGRLAFLPDKGGKTRLIAIGNYWIQEVLIGLHDTLYGMLRRLRQDGTYEQSLAADVVCKATLTDKVWSYDLTAATDRFPIQPQQQLLTFLDKNLECWSDLITSIPFDFKGKQYTYSVGQPMGLYSSWATFTLCHHTIIQYCAWKEGHKTFSKYRVLGDDVAIWDEKVAIRYSNILQLLDVTISYAKSIIPDNQCKPGISAEFAKRIFYNGIEYSAIPANICLMAKRTLWSIPQLFEHLYSRQIDVRSIPVSRIKDAYQLYDKQVLDLCRCFHIWGVIRHDLVKTESLIEYIPEFVKLVHYKLVVNTRYNLLMETAESCLDTLMGAEYEIREELEEFFGDQVPDNLCFIKIMQSRIEDLNETMDRLGSNIFDMVGPNLEVEFRTKYGNPIKITDLEFLPNLSFEEIKSELTDRIPRKIRFSKYLARLVAKVKLLVQD